MILSAPISNSIEIITSQPVKKLMGINPMSLSDPWADTLDIIALNTVKK